MAEPVLSCRLCVVSGLVQGVSFRAYAREQALCLGLRGWARNRADGRVELLVCGEGAAVDALCAWLWRGSPAARVDDVQTTPADPAGCPPGFTVG